MKHLILVTLILLTLDYCTIILTEKIDDGFEVEDRGTICRSSGGQCRRRSIPCGDGYEESEPGMPYCTNRWRRCCYPRQGGMSGNTTDVVSTRIRKRACGTKSKCGIRGGFCIRHGEYCNGNTIHKKGYCTGKKCKCCFTPTVYMRDIENTIAYALRNRAPYGFWGPPSGYRTLDTSQQLALSDFALALIHHLPLRSSLVNFLYCLNSTMPISSPISGEELEEIYINCTKENESKLPYVTTWVGCRNTNDRRIEQLRTYPCGLWITFHAITVNLTDELAPYVLPTLHELVRFFPWCTDCQGHFMEMYEDLNGKDMKTAEDVTMWLWRAHNKVSVRVADGFDGPHNKTWINAECHDIKPKVERLQTLLSACKFKCKMDMKPEDCKYIVVPSAESDLKCTICKPRQLGAVKGPNIFPRQRYNLNTAPENPGRRKSLFPEFKLCQKCWNLVYPSDINGFTTITNNTVVLEYLRMIYNHTLIVGNPWVQLEGNNKLDGSLEL